MTFRVKLYLAIVAVLGIALFAIHEYHSGFQAGQITQKTAVDKQSLTTAQHAEQEANVKADYYKLPIAKQKHSVANARHEVKIAEAGVSITGDSANVNGDTTARIVIPALITIIDRYRVLDTANATLDSLHDKHAAADSIARDAAGKTESASVDVINDLDHQKPGRCSSLKCRVVVGAIVASIAKVGADKLGLHVKLFGVRF
jgi:hypothetical protein